MFLTASPFYHYDQPDYLSPFSALVRIDGEEVWRMDEQQFSYYRSNNDPTRFEWQFWDWRAPSDGSYLMELVFNPSEQDYYVGRFDDIQVKVPEPALTFFAENRASIASKGIRELDVKFNPNKVPNFWMYRMAMLTVFIVTFNLY